MTLPTLVFGGCIEVRYCRSYWLLVQLYLILGSTNE